MQWRYDFKEATNASSVNWLKKIQKESFFVPVVKGILTVVGVVGSAWRVDRLAADGHVTLVERGDLQARYLSWAQSRRWESILQINSRSTEITAVSLPRNASAFTVQNMIPLPRSTPRNLWTSPKGLKHFRTSYEQGKTKNKIVEIWVSHV